MGVAAALSVKVSANTGDFKKQISAMGTTANDVSASVGGLASSFAKLTSAFLASGLIEKAVFGLVNLGREAIANSGHLVDMAAKTGLSTETIQRMSFVAKQTGVSLNTFTDAAFMLGVRLSAGKEGTVNAVERLGLSFAELQKASPDQKIAMVIGALERMGGSQDTNRVAMELFGKSAKSVLQAVRDGYTDLAASANVASDEQVRALDRASDAWDGFLSNLQAKVTGTLGNLVLAAQGAGQLGLAKTLALLASAGAGAGVATLANIGGMPSNKGKNISLPSPHPTPELETEEQRRALLKAQQAAEQFRREMDRLSGKEAISAVSEWHKKIALLGGVTKLAAKDQKAFADALWESVEAMQRLGEGAAPKAIAALREWVSLQKAAFSTGETMKPDRFGISQPVGDSIAIIGRISDATLVHAQKLAEVQALAARLAAQSGPQLHLTEPEIMPSMGPDSFKGMVDKGGFLKQAFGDAKTFGEELGFSIARGLQGGLKGVFSSIGSFIGGTLLGQLGANLAKSIGGMLGGLLGSILGPLGSALGSLLGPLIDKVASLFGNRGRDIIKDFAATFGGFDAMHDELLKMGAAGEEMWRLLTQGTGRNNPEQAAANIETVKKAMEAYKKAVQDITGGVNARAANVTSQADFDVVGAGAIAAFGLQLQQGTPAITAFQSLQTAITAMNQALAAGNVTASESIQQFLQLGVVLETHKVAWDNVAASGQILQAMLQGNIRDAGLFAAVSGDIGRQLQSIIDKGTPTAQVFALAQPQLQALWEAQQKWHFELDATTQSLLDQAAQQGFVGENMRSVNDKILQVLIAIGDVLGAKIPDALRGLPSVAQEAANGMTTAFAGIRMPTIRPDIQIPDEVRALLPPDWQPGRPERWTQEVIEAPEMASGGYVPARAGGTLVRLAEGGEGEYVVPEGRMGGVTVNNYISGSLVHQDDLEVFIARAWARAVRTNNGDAYTMANAALGRG